MSLENIRMLELAAEHLGDLLDEVVFVGGATDRSSALKIIGKERHSLAVP
jgi:hypothetical protein